MTEETIKKFNQALNLDPVKFASDPDAEQWAELFGVLSLGYHLLIVDVNQARQTIHDFSDLNKDQKVSRIIEINNYVSRETEKLEFFYSLYGTRLQLHKIEQIVLNLPDIKSKIAFLYIVETGRYPEEDPEAFNQFSNNLIIKADPELQVENRLQQVMNDRNRLHLGSLEDRRGRVGGAVSAQEVEAYLRRSQPMPTNPNYANPNKPGKVASSRNANLVQPQQPPAARPYPPRNQPPRR
jgi:hypothetical protein